MQNSEDHGVEKIFAAILRVLSRMLIKNNINLNTSVEILKRSLVEAAVEDDRATDSLISLRTGVHRKDVKRLRAALRDGTVEKSPIRGLAMVLSVWANAAPFQDSKGRPRVLRRAGTSVVPGFDDLIRTSKVDLAPATVLQELDAQNLIQIHEDGRIELLSSTFVAQTGEAALEAFEATVTDHLRVAVSNVLSAPGEPRHFDQALRYSHLSAKSVRLLETEARRLARQYLEHMNGLAHRLQSEDDASGQLANGRFVTGTYVAPVLEQPGEETETMKILPKKDQTE